MSGAASILFTALGFIKHRMLDFFKNPGLQRKTFWTMALFCFFLASVSVWTNEHQNVVKISDKLEKERENNQPNIALEQQQYLLMDNSDKDGSFFHLFLNLRVKNIGSDSVVGEWRLKIESPKGTGRLDIMPTMIVPGMKLIDKKRKKVIAQFYENNRLEERTIAPIKRGDHKFGWLYFQIPFTSREQLESSTIKLCVKDILDKEYSMKVDISTKDPKYNTIYIPGSGTNIYKHSSHKD